MTTGRFGAYVFENEQFIPFTEPDKEEMQWGVSLEEQGYVPSERVWGAYPDTYIRVYEAGSQAAAAFQFAAVLKLVSLPHHVFVRDLNGLIHLLRLVQPLVSQTGKVSEDQGEALFGSQGADEQPDDANS